MYSGTDISALVRAMFDDSPLRQSYAQRVKAAQKALADADYLVIGAGAGLSASAGLEYDGKRFTDNFRDFIEKYGMEDLYTSSFYPFATQEEKWAYWAKHIHTCRYEPGILPLYRELLDLVKEKDYFVVTTNVDGQFEKAGFDTDRLFEVQGNYARIQCAVGCHDKLYDNKEMVGRMLAGTADCRIPTGLVPKCPVCEGDMDMNIRRDGYFIEDETWRLAERRYNDFLIRAKDSKTLFLELGVGYSTPQIIRFPFEKMVSENPHAMIIRNNTSHPAGFNINIDQTITFSEDIKNIVAKLTCF